MATAVDEYAGLSYSDRVALVDKKVAAYNKCVRCYLNWMGFSNNNSDFCAAFFGFILELMVTIYGCISIYALVCTLWHDSDGIVHVPVFYDYVQEWAVAAICVYIFCDGCMIFACQNIYKKIMREVSLADVSIKDLQDTKYFNIKQKDKLFSYVIKLLYLPFAMAIVCQTAYTNSKCDMMIASLSATHNIQTTVDRTVSEKAWLLRSIAISIAVTKPGAEYKDVVFNKKTGSFQLDMKDADDRIKKEEADKIFVDTVSDSYRLTSDVKAMLLALFKELSYVNVELTLREKTIDETKYNDLKHASDTILKSIFECMDKKVLLPAQVVNSRISEAKRFLEFYKQSNLSVQEALKQNGVWNSIFNK